MSKYVSNKNDVINKIDTTKKAALETIGLFVEAEAKERCKVKTGTLKRSITNVVGDDKVVIGSNIEYAPYVELGTSNPNYPRQSYLMPAVEDNKKKIQEIANNIFKKLG